MELIWYDILYKTPKTVDKKYLVTFYGKYLTPHMQTTEMVWCCETIRGTKRYFWKWNGIKASGSCVITHWSEYPKPAISEDKYNEFLYK